MAGCYGHIDEAYTAPPIESVNSIQWSADGSMLIAFRSKPVDSAGQTITQSYVDVYDRSGTRLSSTRVGFNRIAPIAVTDDGQHFIFYDDGNDRGSLKLGTLTDTSFQRVGAQGDTSLKLEWSAYIDAISPSGHIMISSKSDGSGIDGAPITYFLTYFNGGTFREMRQWQTHLAGDWHIVTILNDSLFSLEENIGGSDYFSVYDTSLNLRYHQSMPPQEMRGIGFAPSLNLIIAAVNWDGQNGVVNLINLTSGMSQKVLLWPGTGMNSAFDGYHAVYPNGYGVTVRNLVSDNEKHIASDYSILQMFSPDAQVVAYVPLNDESVVKFATVNGLP
ncbi:MAG TPA: hypothetical protein VFH95_10950 [Candidatus Kapabacteria bacterium]|nr:hypothetical protein [Candidatus Kapabacteria bacterium]